MKELLEAGVHFGHQTRRWNPKMKEYIFGERNGIHIIDLQKTLKLFREASRFIGELSSSGKTLLFIGTKRQAQESVAEEANRCGMFYVNHRWLGGTLTNWATLQKSIKRLKTLKAMIEDGRMAQLSKKEAARLDRELKHLKQKISDAVIEGRHAYERSQIADQKAATDAAADGEKVDYVDTSKYESYEKQEGDFIEPGTESESVLETVAEPEPEPDKSVKG